MNATTSPTIDHKMEDFLNRSKATIAVESSILLLIGLTAIGGNLLVVISIYRNPSLRTITYYFVLSLSVTDILYPFMHLPFVLFWSITSRYTFDNTSILCDLLSIVTHSLYAVSILTMILMAVNRFVRVCKPNKYKKWFNKKTCLIMIAAVWILPFTFMTVNIKEKAVFYAKFKPEKIICGLSRTSKNLLSTTLITMLLVVGIGFPFNVILYCYYKIFKKIREHKRNIAPTSNPNSLGTSVQEIKATWTMFAVLIGYCLSWFPFLIVLLVGFLKTLPREVHMMVTYTTAGSSAINPFIYGAMNTVFRQEYKRIVKCQPKEA